MSTTLSRRVKVRAPQSPSGRILTAVTAVIAAIACAVGLAEVSEPGQRSFAERPRSAPANVWPGRLTPEEQARVTEALRSGDAEIREMAASVAAGDAGPAALADPQTLRRHGLNTAPAAAPDAQLNPVERFHHR